MDDLERMREAAMKGQKNQPLSPGSTLGFYTEALDSEDEVFCRVSRLLRHLDPTAQQRVLDYLNKRYGLFERADEPDGDDD